MSKNRLLILCCPEIAIVLRVNLPLSLHLAQSEGKVQRAGQASTVNLAINKMMIHEKRKIFLDIYGKLILQP